ncbi:MAG: tRNA (guanosine(37)-N1)-methyltransferase TrmD, partial [Steroidobacteraceae bacterium]
MTELRIAIVSLFPELFESFQEASFVGRARAQGKLVLHIEPLRRHGLGKHLSVDDAPYGGGSGMLMRVDCVVGAIESAEAALGAPAPPQRILLTPQGQPLDQPLVQELSRAESLILIA